MAIKPRDAAINLIAGNWDLVRHEYSKAMPTRDFNPWGVWLLSNWIKRQQIWNRIKYHNIASRNSLPRRAK